MDVALQGNPNVQVPPPQAAEGMVRPAVEPPARGMPALVVTEAAEMLMEADYAAKKAVVDNLKPSEREKENLRRRKEEIEELRHELLTRKIDLQKARQRFVNMLDHDDVAELSKQADRANGMIRG